MCIIKDNCYINTVTSTIWNSIVMEIIHSFDYYDNDEWNIKE